ncbi:hypothetical protein BKA63DRAFT_253210 [Paraphoma chrysanthemicola]|nr:hypothetical protein BKA63DRAFT_253210 [Paraphoma chrysanthemicola]
MYCSTSALLFLQGSSGRILLQNRRVVAVMSAMVSKGKIMVQRASQVTCICLKCRGTANRRVWSYPWHKICRCKCLRRHEVKLRHNCRSGRVRGRDMATTARARTQARFISCAAPRILRSHHHTPCCRSHNSGTHIEAALFSLKIHGPVVVASG